MKTLAVLAAVVLPLLACDLDPCQSLDLKVCGDDQACTDRPGCIEARRIAGSEVRAACEAALENEISFPLCRQEPDASLADAQ